MKCQMYSSRSSKVHLYAIAHPMLTTFHCVPYLMRFKQMEHGPKHCEESTGVNNLHRKVSAPPNKVFTKMNWLWGKLLVFSFAQGKTSSPSRPQFFLSRGKVNVIPRWVKFNTCITKAYFSHRKVHPSPHLRIYFWSLHPCPFFCSYKNQSHHNRNNRPLISSLEPSLLFIFSVKNSFPYQHLY